MTQQQEATATHYAPIPGWDGYAATPDGRILSLGSNWRGYGVREIRQELNRDGYPCVRLTLPTGKRKRQRVHRLVAFAFIGASPSSAHEVRHLDGQRTNNAFSNLAWGTPKDNADDRTQHGRTSRGLVHSQAIKKGLQKANGGVS